MIHKPSHPITRHSCIPSGSYVPCLPYLDLLGGVNWSKLDGLNERAHILYNTKEVKENVIVN